MLAQRVGKVASAGRPLVGLGRCRLFARQRPLRGTVLVLAWLGGAASLPPGLCGHLSSLLVCVQLVTLGVGVGRGHLLRPGAPELQSQDSTLLV